MSVYKKYGIYGIRNLVNGKIYVGKTTMNFGDRWDSHRACLRGGYHGNNYLQRSWDKYGEDNFEFIILVDCVNGEDTDAVNQLEIEQIEKYRKLGLSYNIHDGGAGGLFKGKHLSEETKRKIGEKNRINMTGRKASEETKRKMSISQKKRYEKWTEEDRKEWGKKISASQSGLKKPKLSLVMQGNKNGAKYTLDQVNEIRRLHEVENKGYTEISQIMNIPRHSIYLIATYRRWKTA